MASKSAEDTKDHYKYFQSTGHHRALLLTISFNILGCILVPSSDLDRLKRQAVAAICIGKTVGYSRAQDRTFYNSTGWLIGLVR